MKRYLTIATLGAILSLGSNSALAQDIVMDLGNFPAPPCIRPQNIPGPNTQSDYGQQVVRVTAKVFLEPANPTTIAAARACAHDAQAALAGARSFSNIKLFGETFQDYIATCTRRANVGIRSVKALLATDSSCQRDGQNSPSR